ncbi:acetylhydrolase [Pseudomaricurvus alkylphenolicus]|uniref:alpha/beta hydrolase family protein n=1 Tax=Pseudomaricurvus alkylphenolicus TaxID=1306991 RepID=UPI001421ABBC|nr:acetylhydrolase [Pseudomaricurvus alkylphenolicus]NIB44200.1 acetylhydrolase [Pseudomaricurvus alkylphenolicus]
MSFIRFNALAASLLLICTPFLATHSYSEQLYPPFVAKLQPQLAQVGTHKVGVRTLKVVHGNQLDFRTFEYHDRPLTLEVWYPARASGNERTASYGNVTRKGKRFSLTGTAFRDAQPLQTEGGFPLVVISHGYTGYRTLMFYLAEHLASHGYVVAGIDHTDSTNADISNGLDDSVGFPSTLYHRSRDQQFALDYLYNTSFVHSNLDTDNAGLIGFSMGGYGLINTVGGCYQFTRESILQLNPDSTAEQISHFQTLLNTCTAGKASSQPDPRWKAAIALAPWGQQLNLHDRASLATIKTPLLYVSGDLDDVSHYPSIERLYQDTGSRHKYLLTLLNARHNIAPHPAPAVAYEDAYDLEHYFEPAWSLPQLNQINRHFALAMMDCHVKNLKDRCKMLELSGNSGTKPHWPGFPARFSTGMTWLNGHSSSQASAD